MELLLIIFGCAQLAFNVYMLLWLRQVSAAAAYHQLCIERLNAALKHQVEVNNLFDRQLTLLNDHREFGFTGMFAEKVR